MKSQAANTAELFTAAAQAGELSQQSLASLTAVDLGHRIQDALGVPPEQFEESEAFLLTLVVDDTGSIAGANMEDTLREGVNQVLTSVDGSKKRRDVLVHIVYLYDGIRYDYTPLASAARLDRKNYRADAPSTPLYQQTHATLATVLAKTRDFRSNGIPVRSVTLIATDGYDNASQIRPEQVAALVKDMLKDEHIICAMGIGNDPAEFKAVFRRMGIPDKWILTPSDDPHAIRQAFQIASRASAAASQSAGSFSQTAAGGGFAA